MPTALITGPTAGLGRAFAAAYARRVFDLVLVSRDAARLEQVAAQVRDEYAVDVEALPADLGNRDDVERVVARIEDTGRPVDALVNNAGYGRARSFSDSTFDDEERSLDVLVRAPLRLSHAAVKLMERRGHGEIVNVSSLAGFLPRGTYGAHKAWLTSLTEWMSLTYGGNGVRITALCPGLVRTEFHRRAGMDVSKVPGWMWLDPDDVVAHAIRDLLAGKAVSVPSRRYQVLGTAARIAPRSVVAGLTRSVRGALSPHLR